MVLPVCTALVSCVAPVPFALVDFQTRTLTAPVCDEAAPLARMRNAKLQLVLAKMPVNVFSDRHDADAANDPIASELVKVPEARLVPASIAERLGDASLATVQPVAVKRASGRGATVLQRQRGARSARGSVLEIQSVDAHLFPPLERVCTTGLV